MKRRKVLVLDDLEEDFFVELKKHCEFVRELGEQSKDAEILVVRSRTRVDERLLKKLPNLKLVITATHGEDHIDKIALAERNISYRIAPVQSYDVAQGVMAYILAFATNLVIADRCLKRGEWKKSELKGFRVEGKTLGIVGYGRIGKEVARQAIANGMEVVAYDKDLKVRVASDLPVCFVDDLDELLKRSDIITLHVPLTSDTKGMIGERELSMVKDGAYVINATRGDVVDEEALLRALNTGKIAGAALDVFKTQPPFGNTTSSEALARHEKVIATPHSVAQTKEALRQKGERVLEEILRYIASDVSRY
ncbi:MAG: NAD(P)-dependent oxidoreductase [Candidatus Bathyarchaeia archaeon]